MKKWIIIFLSFLSFPAHVFAQENKQEVIDIGSHRELFVDRYLIETMINSRLELHHPTDEGTVMYFAS